MLFARVENGLKDESVLRTKVVIIFYYFSLSRNEPWKLSYNTLFRRGVWSWLLHTSIRSAFAATSNGSGLVVEVYMVIANN